MLHPAGFRYRWANPGSLAGSGVYQLPFWQPPPSDPVLPVGVHSRLTAPLTSLLIEKVWPSVASAVTTYSSVPVTVTVFRHALLVLGQPTMVFSYACNSATVMPV